MRFINIKKEYKMLDNTQFILGINKAYTYHEYVFGVNNSPFQNCQVFGISDFEELYNYVNAHNEIKNINEIIKSIKEICKINKPLLMLDIYHCIFLKIKKYVNMYSYKSYMNTTGSKMVICLIKT